MGVRQLPHLQRRQAGVRFAPTLFSIFFSIMLHEAKEDANDLTNRQAALVTEAKKNGKFGYITKGELVVEDRRPSRTKAAHRQKQNQTATAVIGGTTSPTTTTMMTTQSCNDQTTDISVTHPPSVMPPSATATLQPGVTVLVLSTSVGVTLTTEAGLHWVNMR